MKIKITAPEAFEARHNSSLTQGIDDMLRQVGVNSLEELMDQTVPVNIRTDKPLDLPAPLDENAFLLEFKNIVKGNSIFKSYIGMGYYDCHTPSVILRNILENPGWYTAYTPYQAEIAQGRLEALVNFQTMICDLTGMELANSSLLDEGTAAAEAMSMFFSLRKGSKKQATSFFVDENTFPQTLDILQTRAQPLGINLVIGDVNNLDFGDADIFGLLLQYPDSNGRVNDIAPLISSGASNDIKVAVAADLLSLVLLKSPGEMGADVVLGSSQRFGVPMGYGGPHAAFFATREEFKRQVPGRIIGLSKDTRGKVAYRMALQTREQHIKRERATSNICTAQVLLAVMSGMYAVYHGPKGLRRIAERVHGLTCLLSEALKKGGIQQVNDLYFDTLKVKVTDMETVRSKAVSAQMNFRYFEDGHIGISLDETTRFEDVAAILEVFGLDSKLNSSVDTCLQDNMRDDKILTHEVFNTYHSEHEMLRYLKRLENKDLSLTHSMISLGSCTMKLNATTEMIPITWPELSSLHPFVPRKQAAGYRRIIEDLEKWLSEITGFTAVSLQPNSGAQGEFAGLMVIRAYHESRGEGHRNVILAPSSAHGTNPASAVMAGAKIVIVACDDRGNIDIADLKAKAEQHSENLSALMVTYPSTHGVFEAGITEVCDVIHQHGGQVYMDGANLNAQIGLTNPVVIGADVCHLNLHKTFCIPHGGGGPGMGPIGVVEHLAPFLPGNPMVKTGGDQAITAISAAPWGSAGILPISYAYIAMMGAGGLSRATQLAILNANYIKSKLEQYYPILYTGENGRCAHEMIVDCRGFKQSGIEVEDIAKRLMDYGYHAPTVSFPVPGTLMIEPTESETQAELDRFCSAMIAIREEVREVEEGHADKEDNVLKNSPHTADVVTANTWDRSYSREKAAYPLDELRERKFWPSVSRIDNAYGDRHLFCSCVPVGLYEEE